MRPPLRPHSRRSVRERNTQQAAVDDSEQSAQQEWSRARGRHDPTAPRGTAPIGTDDFAHLSLLRLCFVLLSSRARPPLSRASPLTLVCAAALARSPFSAVCSAAVLLSSSEYARASTSNDGEPTEADYQQSRTLLLSAAGALTVIGYAAYVVAGEPAHAAAHPHYQPPYAFVKRNMETGAGWWPGRHCQFFEFNCFAQTYAVSHADKREYTQMERHADKSKRVGSSSVPCSFRLLLCV